MQNRNAPRTLGSGDTHWASEVEVWSVKARLYYLDLQPLDHRTTLAPWPPHQALGSIDIRTVEPNPEGTQRHLDPRTLCHLAIPYLKYTYFVEVL